MDFFKVIKERRSVYSLSDKSAIADNELADLVKSSVMYTPSPFNMQNGRVVLLLNSYHKKLWNIVLKSLKEITSVDKIEQTKNKISLFSNSYGTVLFYEDIDTIKMMQNEYPAYKDNFPIWSTQSIGMMQYSVWLSFYAKGIGANLQHYNPLIDKETAKYFDIPSTWKLSAQMPFGGIEEESASKTFLPIDSRFKILK